MGQTNSTCVIVRPEEIVWQEEEVGALAAGQLRIRSLYGSAKHGTELADLRGDLCRRGSYRNGFFDGKPKEVSFPQRPGNQFVGEVIAVGEGVTNRRVGEVVWGYGCFSRFHTVAAEQVFPLAEGCDWRSALCYDPLQFALSAVRDGQVRIGDAVACFGLGAIGLMLVQCLRLAGASRVIACDPIPRRREAASNLGAHVVLDPIAVEAGAEIRALTEGRGADVCIDFSGKRQALQACLRGVAYGGTVVCGAFPPPMDGGLDLGAEAHFNIPRIVFTRACSQPDRDHPRWSFERIQATARQLIDSGAVSGVGVIDPVVAPEEVPTVYREIATHPERSIKLGVDFGAPA
jgi:threonine dehydrogenase-like Zn-dependent dehydrogenase